MKRIKTHYDTLRVARTATQDVIRSAYGSAIKKHQSSDRSENSAAALIKIEDAYRVLSDPEQRRVYDARVASMEGSDEEELEPPVNPAPPKPTLKTPVVEPPAKQENLYTVPEVGSFSLDELPDTVKNKLIARTSGKESGQYGFSTDGIAGPYLWIAAGLCWFWYLIWSAMENRWSKDEGYWMIAGTVIAASLIAYQIARLLDRHQSPIRSWFIVTPVYIIQTSCDRVCYWPICRITDVKVTHNYSNGSLLISTQF